MIYKCEQCKKECNVIRLDENKRWICDRCAFPTRKSNKEKVERIKSVSHLQ